MTAEMGLASNDVYPKSVFPLKGGLLLDCCTIKKLPRNLKEKKVDGKGELRGITLASRLRDDIIYFRKWHLKNRFDLFLLFMLRKKLSVSKKERLKRLPSYRSVSKSST